jgi:hypothetical protein
MKNSIIFAVCFKKNDKKCFFCINKYCALLGLLRANILREG